MIVLELTDVEVWFANGPRVLHSVSLTVAAGQHWALLGPNGAGKSTLLGIAGAQRFPSSGTAEVLGQRLGRVDVRELRRRIGSVDSRLRLPAELSVADYVATGATQTVQLLAPPTGPTRSGVSDLLRLLGLDDLAGRSVAVCSQGEQARARLARALVADPALLLLDEPAAGLDLPGRADLLAALERTAADHPDLASVTVAHHLEELPSTTTHVALLRAGRVVGSGEVSLLGDAAELSRCFDRPVRAVPLDGRWFATADRRPPAATATADRDHG